MRITLIGTLLLFSALARCQRASEIPVPACVTDCQKSLAEHGLLIDGMKSTCAAPKLQRAHFQCLINFCSPESYGRALAYSVSACCDTGVNIIPLHPIDISQLPQHKRSLQSEESGKTHAGDKSTALNQESGSAPNFAVALTCNTGQDGVITVSLGSPGTSLAAASVAESKDLFSVNRIMTSVLSNGPATMSLHNAVFMDKSRGLESDSTADCVSSNSGHRTTSGTTTTQTQSASCKSNGSRFGSTPTSTACGSLGQLVSTTSQTYPSAPCTSSRASNFGDSRSTVQVTSSTNSRSQTLEHLTSSCTSSLSQTDAGSSNWPSDNESASTTDCSDGEGRRASSTILQTPADKSRTLDSNQWSTSRLSSSDIPCSSGLARSSGSSSQSSTLASAISRNSITSTSCTASGRSSSPSFAHSSSTLCPVSTKAGTSRGRSETAHTTNTMSSTTSSKFTISSSSDGDFAATPAAYTFSSFSLLPPAYVPSLEEYGYGTPPPVYGFPSQRNGGDDPQSSGALHPASSLGQASSSGSGRQNGNPVAYGTSSAWPTRMAHAVPTHATNTDHTRSTLRDISNPVEITLISSVSGEGLQTTIITVNQAQATSLTMPLALATNSLVGGRLDFSASEEGSQSSSQHSGSSDEFNNSRSVGFETPMPAMLVGGSATTGPSIHVLISAMSIAAGFFTCIL